MQILVNSTNDFLKRMTIIQGQRYLPPNYPSSKKLNSTVIKEYFQMEELYLSQIQAQIITTVENSYQTFIDSYLASTEIIFILFMVFFAFVFLYGRNSLIRKMNYDVYKSRTILGLIPNKFFHQNKQLVDKLITKL